MNASETQTERLAPLILVRSSLTVMNSSTSGCQSWSMSMVAPRLEPPCWTISCVATEKRVAQLIGPEEVPFTFLTLAPLGRSEDKLRPTPPALAWISTSCPKDSRMPPRESLGDGMTKQLK